MGKPLLRLCPLSAAPFPGAITYATFKPMGGRLADVLVRNLNGEFDETGMELRPEFKKANTADADTEVTIHEIEIDD